MRTEVEMTADVPGLEALELLRLEMKAVGWPTAQYDYLRDLARHRIFCMLEPAARFALALRPHQSNLIAPRERYGSDEDWMTYGGGNILRQIIWREPEAIYYCWHRGQGLSRIDYRNVFRIMCEAPASAFRDGARVRIANSSDTQLGPARGRMATVLTGYGPFVSLDVDGVGIRRCLPEFLQLADTAPPTFPISQLAHAAGL
jgi:hypothetical protein